MAYRAQLRLTGIEQGKDNLYMTKREFCKAVAAANPGMVCQWKPATEEYRIAFRGEEASAYYTNDQDDAAATARLMWEQRYPVKSANERMREETAQAIAKGFTAVELTTAQKPIVKNGELVNRGIDPDAYAKCDRCGRMFSVKYSICVCRG